MIKHIWFDFSDTLASINEDVHKKLRYETYAKIINKPVTKKLMDEYENLYEKHQHSNSSVFQSLGMVSSFWSGLVNSSNPGAIYRLTDPNIPQVFVELRKIIPISIFSNINLGNILPALRINQSLFVNLLSSIMVGKAKPALDGYKKVIDLSGLLPEEILYIGNDIGKDVMPAKAVGIKTGVMFKKADEADYFFPDFNAILEFVKNEKSKQKI